MQIRDFPAIPLQLPERDILKRMGYNLHLSRMSARQEELIAQGMQEAFALCRPCGRYMVYEISGNDGRCVRFADVCMESAALCNLLRDSSRVALLAATVGAAPGGEAARLLREGRGSEGVIYDAVASETADAALDWLQNHLAGGLPRTGSRLCGPRFSPGYGDLGLAAQRDIFGLLRLEELGLALTDSFMLLPEKSVTALAGIAG